MPRIVSVPSQCLYLADGATMRTSWPTPLPLPRTTSSPQVVRRLFHISLLRAREPGVFPNSLEKTLHAHRSSNRARLIRKLIPKAPPATIFRPVLPSEHVAIREPPSEAPSSATIQPTQSTPSRKHSKGQRVLKRVGYLRPRFTSVSLPKPSRQLRWAANGKDRPAQHPWLHHIPSANSKPREAFSQLDAEIRALEKYLTPTQPELARVDHLAMSISHLLGEAAPHDLQIVGSRNTGMALAHSDLNFVLLVNDGQRSVGGFRKCSATRPRMIGVYNELLRKVERILLQTPTFCGVYKLSKGIPVVAAIHQPTGLQLQFYCSEEVPGIIEHIRDYHAEYPTLRPLYMAVRLILETRGIFSTDEASIGSNALLMLLVAFLKMNHGRFQRRDSLGEQLLSFLEVYGTGINFRTTGVSVDPPGFFNADTIKEETEGRPPESIEAHLRGQRSLLNQKRTAAARRNFTVAERLCVQDPANYMNDLGRACSRTAELQQILAKAHKDIRTSIEAWDSKEGRKNDSILAHALQANFDDFERLRSQIAGPPSTA